jgi:hypothetical protein
VFRTVADILHNESARGSDLSGAVTSLNAQVVRAAEAPVIVAPDSTAYAIPWQVVDTMRRKALKKLDFAWATRSCVVSFSAGMMSAEETTSYPSSLTDAST